MPTTKDLISIVTMTTNVVDAEAVVATFPAVISLKRALQLIGFAEQWWNNHHNDDGEPKELRAEIFETVIHDLGWGDSFARLADLNLIPGVFYLNGAPQQ